MSAAAFTKAMSELETIRTVLQRASRRHRLAKALRVSIYGLFAGALLSLVWLGLYHFLPLLKLLKFPAFLGMAVNQLVVGSSLTWGPENQSRTCSTGS